ARQTFLGLWIRMLVEGKPFEVWEGHQLRDFTYVDDAVEAFLMAATSEATNGEIFNLGGDCVISLNELANLLIEINGGGEFVTRSHPREKKAHGHGRFFRRFPPHRRAGGVAAGAAPARGTATPAGLLSAAPAEIFMPPAIPQSDPKAGYLAHKHEIDQ